VGRWQGWPPAVTAVLQPNALLLASTQRCPEYVNRLQKHRQEMGDGGLAHTNSHRTRWCLLLPQHQPRLRTCVQPPLTTSEALLSRL
jgi:hypothetical protein